MAYTAMYRKYRPLVFSDVIGQDHIVRALSGSIASGKISHAYLFCGTRGTGKTTLAKIFARAINCLHPVDGNPCNECEICRGILDESIVDVMEIDAASNNGVDSVRDIRDDVAYTPTACRYKVYIIDEVHMLSTSAFNALLKTLEEPPEHAVFLLATTDPQKLPDTILSRVQRYNLRRISNEDIAARLLYIADDMKLTLSRETALYIAQLADGALRDAISILDRCYSSGTDITMDLVADITGTLSRAFIYDACLDLVNCDTAAVLDDIARITDQGRRLSDFTDSLMAALRELLVYLLSQDKAAYRDGDAGTEFMRKAAEVSTPESVARLIAGINEAASGMKWSSAPEIVLSASMIGLCNAGAADGTSVPTPRRVQQTAGASSDSDRRITVLERRITDLSARLEEALAAGRSLGAGGDAAAGADGTHAEEPIPDEPMPKGDLDKYPPYEFKDELISMAKDDGNVSIMLYLKNRPIIAPSDRLMAVVFERGQEEIRKLVASAETVQLLTSYATRIAGHPVKVIMITRDSIGRQLGEAERELQGAQELADSLGTPLTIED